MARIFDCARVADELLAAIADRIEDLNAKPNLHIYRLTKDAETDARIRAQSQAAKRVGIECHIEETHGTADDVITSVIERQQDSATSGLTFAGNTIIDDSLLRAVNPNLDVDCQGRQSRLMLNLTPKGYRPPIHLPTTPSACLHLLERYGIGVDGTNVAVFGKGYLGSAVHKLLTNEGANVQVFDRTHKPKGVLDASVVVSASNTPCIRSEMLKKGCTFVDLSRIPGGSVIDFKEASERCNYITSNNNPVCSVANAQLMGNVLNTYERGGKRRAA